MAMRVDTPRHKITYDVLVKRARRLLGHAGSRIRSTFDNESFVPYQGEKLSRDGAALSSAKCASREPNTSCARAGCVRRAR